MHTKDEEYLAALEAEREGYERAGRTERLRAVDAEISRLRGVPAKEKPTTRPGGAQASTRTRGGK